MIFFSGKKKWVKKSSTISGWTSKEKLEFLYESVKNTRRIKGEVLEIGSAWGRSTVTLAKAARSKKVYSIDPHTGGIAYINRGENQDSYSDFISNLKKFHVRDKVKVLKKTTLEVLEQSLLPANLKVSFAFIDGLHTYKGVLLDLELINNHLSEGAMVVLDDYYEPFDGYKEGILEASRKYGFNLIENKTIRLVYFKR